MKILHWYHDLLNLYGDYGNLEVLKKHLLDQDVDAEIMKKSLEEEVSLEDYDMVYIGSGTEKKLEMARKDILRFKNDIRIFVEEGGVLLSTGNAMELFGTAIDDKEALGILPFTAKQTKDRYVGDVILHNDELGEIVGFINKCSLIEGGEKEVLFSYVYKDTALKDNAYEGFAYHHLYGTHVIGPVLVKNPSFLKHIVKLLLDKEGKPYKELSYPYEEKSYEGTYDALRKRMEKK